MNLTTCNCRCSCTAVAWISSVIVGIFASFLQITAVITVTPIFLWVALAVSIAYLAVLTVSGALMRRAEVCFCRCSVLNTILVGILGTILLALILLAVSIVATSLVSAILVGVLLFFFALTLTATACLVRCLYGCENQVA